MPDVNNPPATAPVRAPREGGAKRRRANRSASEMIIASVAKMPLPELILFAEGLAREQRVTAEFLSEKLAAALVSTAADAS